jgi:hypothetical protein
VAALAVSLAAYRAAGIIAPLALALLIIAIIARAKRSGEYAMTHPAEPCVINRPSPGG